jgi:hypothetical protein
MEQAAARAGALGRVKLQALLVEEVQLYPRSPKTTAAMVYGQIKDAVDYFEGQIPPFAAVLPWVARQYGMMTREFKERYRRARKVYDAAVRFRRHVEELQQRQV